MRRSFRDAFDAGLGARSLTARVISMARGEDLEDLVKAMIEAAGSDNANADKVIRALGGVLNSGRATSLAAIQFAKRVGFGADPKTLDNDTVFRLAAELVAQAVAEAEARKVAAAATDTKVVDVTAEPAK